MPTLQELKTQLIELFQQRDELHNKHATLLREQEPIKALATEIKRMTAALDQPLSKKDHASLSKLRLSKIEQYNELINDYKTNPHRDFLDQQRHVVQLALEDRKTEIDTLSKQIQQMENTKTIQPAQLNMQRDSTVSTESNKPSMPGDKRSPPASDELDSRDPSPLRLN